ncbi:MAG TPA: pyridoxamine 5'-phosphate oxidase [Steroidobacteraceae bacterium]|jgi:pyridoxamine 5'-phosphate oxidase|nr:pyridoxamine 5'-phosphate oxidase [Steroidobacteraceae bacterium]
MSSNKKTFWTETLPEILPANPLEIAAQWLAEAKRNAAQPNPDAMVLATVDERGHPSARVVLCKEIAAQHGYLLFYTNYGSRKGSELEGNPRAAIVFHWDHLHRQVRAEGRVQRLSDLENDAYHRTRPWQKQVGVWASQQSQPVESRQALAAAVSREARRFGIPYDGPGSAEPDEISVTVPRPPNWGGYRLYVDAVELWVEGEYRIHDRARWTRSLLGAAGTGATAWSATRLQP